MQQQHLVSIIMPSYNSEEFIEESINSILQQTYQNYELIVIDDCSIDRTREIIKSIDNDKIKIIENKINSGTAISRNNGISIAKGRYIAFLDSDDLWHKEKLEKQLLFMKENNLPFSYTAYTKIDKKNQKIGSVEIPSSISRKDLLKTCYIGCLTAIYDTKMIGKFYMPTDTLREDYATWLNIIKQIGIMKGIQTPLAFYRIHNKQNSKKKIKMAYENWLIYRNQEKLNFFSALYFFLNYAIRGVIRNKL